MGPIVPQLGGLRLDLLGPARLIGRATVQLDGQAQITRSVPADAPVFDVVWAQAVIRRGVNGVDSVKSNTTERNLGGK